MGQELGDGATHGVADGDDGPAAQRVDQGGGVVGGVLEQKGSVGADPPAVAAVVAGSAANLSTICSTNVGCNTMSSSRMPMSSPRALEKPMLKVSQAP